LEGGRKSRKTRERHTQKENYNNNTMITVSSWQRPFVLGMLWACCCSAPTGAFLPTASKAFVPLTNATRHASTIFVAMSTTTELRYSLSNSEVRAVEAIVAFQEGFGSVAARCRVDFDTSVGDETFLMTKTSAKFMQ
jgi:hypothetical protein